MYSVCKKEGLGLVADEINGNILENVSLKEMIIERISREFGQKENKNM